jgi:hypothetical protein
MPPPSEAKATATLWVTRAATHATLVFGLSIAALYTFVRWSDRALLLHYGLEPSQFSSSTTDSVIDGLPTVILLTAIFGVVAYIFRRPLRWISEKAEEGGIAGTAQAWLTSDPTKQVAKALTLSGVILVVGALWILFWSAEVSGSWRHSRANWIVSANGCSQRCFSYKIDDRDKPIVGYPIKSGSDRIAVVIAKDHIAVIDNDKFLEVEAFRPKNPPAIRHAPLYMRVPWYFLDLLNGNWSNPL